jgi:hypothetical protein
VQADRNQLFPRRFANHFSFAASRFYLCVARRQAGKTRPRRSSSVANAEKSLRHIAVAESADQRFAPCGHTMLRQRISGHPLPGGENIMKRADDRMIAGRLDSAALIHQIGDLIARVHQPVAVERRHHQRLAMPVLFQLTPLDTQGEALAELAITVVGKDLSPRGLSFFHSQPLPYRRAIVSLDHPDLGPFAVEVDIRWCRFARAGWYESGGRLLRAVDFTSAAQATGGRAVNRAS